MISKYTYITMMLALLAGSSFATEPARNLRPSEILVLLREPVDGRLFAEPAPLGEMLRRLQLSLAVRGRFLPIRIDDASFKAESPEAPDIRETKVAVDCGPRPTAQQALVAMLQRTDATFVVAPGYLEITTYDSARGRIISPVVLHARSRPLGEVLDDLFEQTGVGISIDPRVAPRLREPVSVTFARPTPLSTALSVVLNNGKLRYIRLGDTVFVTTPATAFRIELEEFAPRPAYWDLMTPYTGGTPPTLADLRKR